VNSSGHQGRRRVHLALYLGDLLILMAWVIHCFVPGQPRLRLRPQVPSNDRRERGLGVNSRKAVGHERRKQRHRLHVFVSAQSMDYINVKNLVALAMSETLQAPPAESASPTELFQAIDVLSIDSLYMNVCRPNLT